jgi:ABC-type molybdate transport system substrate-binding protein
MEIRGYGSRLKAGTTASIFRIQFQTAKVVIARSEATKQSISPLLWLWIASLRSQ